MPVTCSSSAAGAAIWSRLSSSRASLRDTLPGKGWDGQDACLFSKRLETGRFVWPSAKEGKVSLTAAQLSMLLEGIDWRVPQRSWKPLKAG